jgi:hypothetical protein
VETPSGQPVPDTPPVTTIPTSSATDLQLVAAMAQVLQNKASIVVHPVPDDISASPSKRAAAPLTLSDITTPSPKRPKPFTESKASAQRHTVSSSINKLLDVYVASKDQPPKIDPTLVFLLQQQQAQASIQQQQFMSFMAQQQLQQQQFMAAIFCKSPGSAHTYTTSTSTDTGTPYSFTYPISPSSSSSSESPSSSAGL